MGKKNLAAYVLGFWFKMELREMGLIVALIDDSASSGKEIRRLKKVVAQHGGPADFQVGNNENNVDYESCGSYHNLHLLRGFAIYLEKEGRLPSTDERESDYPLLQLQYEGAFETAKFAHLIEHSDCEGYYVPIPLTEPIFTEEGESIGSVFGLLDELNLLKEWLWQGTDANLEGPEVLWKIDRRDPLGKEKLVWCKLRWLCRNARKFNLVMSFCG